MGRGRLRRGAAARRADFPQRRLLDVLLVPRHGARGVRERAHRRTDERGLRLRQGRPRGTAGRGRTLHDGHAGIDRPGRLADERVPHSAGRAVLRRHLLPAARPPRPAGVPQRPAKPFRRLAGQPRRTRADRRSAPRHPPQARPAAGARGRLNLRRRPADRARQPIHRRLRPAARRLRHGPEVSAGNAARNAALRPTLLRAGQRRLVARDPPHARRDGRGRPPRPPGRRLPPLQHRRQVARAALRDNALRPGVAGVGLHRGVQAVRGPAVLPRGPRDFGLRAARHD